MAWHGFLVKAAPHLVTFAAYEALHHAVAKAPWREATVTAMACGIRGARKAEVGAERARLAAADMFAEAIERSGEGVPASAVANEKVASPAAAESGNLDH